jgi:hypothetical protein
MSQLGIGLLLALAFAAPVHAQRAVIGLHFGFPLYWPPPYYYYPYYGPPPVYYPPPVYPPYVLAPPEPPRYFFYCPATDAYYPYVRECPQGWQRVPAEPPR